MLGCILNACMRLLSYNYDIFIMEKFRDEQISKHGHFELSSYKMIEITWYLPRYLLFDDEYSNDVTLMMSRVTRCI